MTSPPPGLVGLLSLLVLGCPGPAPVRPDAGHLDDGGAVPLVEVGTGIDQFLPLVEGQEVTIIHGPQGGYHVWTALRANASVDPKQAEVTVRLKLDGGELSHNGYRLNLVSAGAYYEWYAMQALIPDPAAVAGQLVCVRVELTDSTGLTGFDERCVIPRP